MLLAAGARNISVVDSKGILSRDRKDLSAVKLMLVEDTNLDGTTGDLAHALDGADVFIGVSGGQVPEPVVASMAHHAIIFALANPNPEVHPDIAHRHAQVVATGRSDYPNQINNVLAFPGIFRGAFDARRPPDHRGHEARSGGRPGRPGRRRAVRGVRHPRAVRPAGRAGSRPGGGRGCSVD